MAREIKGYLFCISYHYASSVLVECESKDDLFRYVAQDTLKGYAISSVVEITNSGRRPRVSVFTDKRYKEIYREMENNKKENL